MTDIVFVKYPNRTVWFVESDPTLQVWRPCDKKTYVVQKRDGDTHFRLKSGFRKREHAEAFIAKLIRARANKVED